MRILKRMPLVIGSLLIILLSGCLDFSMEPAVTKIFIQVEPNGSGIISASVGVPQYMVNYLESDVLDQMIDEVLLGIERTNISVTKRIDDTHLWADLNYSFKNPAELNKLLAESTFFIDAKLTRKFGLITDSYIFDATTKSKADMFTNTEQNQSSGRLFNPANFLNIDVIVSLPGEIRDYNGYKISGSNNIQWSITADQPTYIHVESNQQSTIRLMILLFPAGVLIIGGLVAVILLFRRSPEPQSKEN